MKILGISASPKPKGNTAYAVKYALDIVRKENAQTKYLSLANKEIGFCKSCRKCEKEYKCWQEDYMTIILDAMR